MNISPSRRGFAFLELLVTIALLALVGSATYVFVIAPPKIPELTVKKEPFAQQQPQSEMPHEEKNVVSLPSTPVKPPIEERKEDKQQVPPSLPPPFQPPPSVKPPSVPQPKPPPAPQSVTYSGFFNFPDIFFQESVVSKEQMIKVTDAQYQSLKKMHNGIAPYIFSRIEYDPPVYGSTIPNGIKLGDAAFPALNNGHPRWAVMAHEQGHNFFGGTSIWYNTIAVPGPFLQESLAVLSAFFTYHNILENQQAFGIDGKTIESLNYDFANDRNYQKQQYELYISQGKRFDDQDVLTSQALDYKMIIYGETYGWQNYTKLAKAFENGIANQFTFQNEGVSVMERSTYIVAALGAAFNRDFREDFRNLNFPIVEPLYADIYSKIKNHTQ
jgi:prepilin-type N-terminal cleavage/methylation domain-containing protein